MLSVLRANVHRRGRWPVLAALMVFMLAKGFAPAGYMLTDGSSPGLYILCHGDVGSAQLLKLASTPEHDASAAHAAHDRHYLGAQGEPHQNQGHELASHQAKQGMCLYAALVLLAFLTVIVAVFLLATPVEAIFFYAPLLPHRPARFLPAVRAPPLPFIA